MSFVGFKRPRVRAESHLDFIRTLPCVCCGNALQTEAAHIRTGNLFYGKRPTGGGEKPSDVWTLPLCNNHHREQHTMNESEFWRAYGVKPFVLALSLFACSGNIMTAESVISHQVNHD
jgi:hypothetical protein